MQITDEEKHSEYKYKGKPLNLPIARYIIETHFAGKTKKRIDLIREVDAYHLENGGLTTEYKRQHPVGLALSDLKKKGLVRSLSLGTWYIKSQTSETSQSSSDTKNDENESAAPKIIGGGKAYVYLYYLPNDKRLAELEDKSTFECKIGETVHYPDYRIWEQIKTALSDEPIIGLIIKTDVRKELEQYIHDVLKAVGRHKENALGTEWFFTNPDEVEKIYDALQRIEGTIL